ncbi:RluA family pseudouridine synthase [Geoalkalibacter sp.]|uniref:RluA family pseudouridine synthase n=1 Tax=Geoalkalibacter sp. TaxID=3041440 RepID=UPI00272DE264|nr:RluA family pseudouridine synthase [Geoalkalibacter sp.]
MNERAMRPSSYRLGVAAGDVGERLDLFLVRAVAGVSRKKVKQALDEGRVQVDGEVVRRAGHLLRGGEQIQALLAVDAKPAAPSLGILYQDDWLLAVDKPAGLAPHRTSGGGPNALDLAAELLGRRENPPILLHRLDQDTSGVLLLALTPEANRELARQFSDREVEKIYLALVKGSPPDAFEVSNHLKAKSRGRTVAVRSGGLAAQTSFITRHRGEGFALVEAYPRTGRTHQIRAHLAGEGYPLLGDILYGGPAFVEIDGCSIAVPRHLLHAWKLCVRHPASGLSLALQAPIPDDFSSLLPNGFNPSAVCAPLG